MNILASPTSHLWGCRVLNSEWWTVYVVVFSADDTTATCKYFYCKKDVKFIAIILQNIIWTNTSVVMSLDVCSGLSGSVLSLYFGSCFSLVDRSIGVSGMTGVFHLAGIDADVFVFWTLWWLWQYIRWVKVFCPTFVMFSRCFLCPFFFLAEEVFFRLWITARQWQIIVHYVFSVSGL